MPEASPARHPGDRYHAAVISVLCAGGCLRDGPLLLGALVRDGHLENTFPAEDTSGGPCPADWQRSRPGAPVDKPMSRRQALKVALTLNDLNWIPTDEAGTGVSEGVGLESARPHFTYYALRFTTHTCPMLR